MTERTRGFTMIEVLVVVAIIGILATITFMGFGRYQADVRDTARASKATVIAEALEKYYDKNGEYPSCPSVTGAATTVTTSVLPGIDAQVLVAPQASSGTTNSVACNDLTDISQDDFFAYVGDSSPTCKTGQACLLYELKYKQESTGQIISLESRRKTNIGPTDAPVCSASTIGFNQINTSWTAIASASSYDIVRATDSAFTANVVSQNINNPSFSAIGLNSGTTYYFKARANTAVGAGNWCDTAIASTWSVGKPSITLGAVTATSIGISWAATSHATTYTAQRSTDQSNWTSTCADIATTSCNFTGLTTGVTYYLRVMAKNGSNLSAWSNTVSSSTLLGIPTATYGSVTATTITFNWSTVPGAARYESQYRINDGAWSAPINEGTGTTRTHGPTTQGSKIELQARAVDAGGKPGGWSSVVGTTLLVSTPAWNAWGRSEAYPSWQTWVYQTSGASLCPAGTTINTQFRDGIYGSYWNAWGGWGSNGSSSSTLKYSSTIANYSSTLQTEINGYCKNESSGATSAVISAGVSTTSHTPPNVVLSGPVECAGAYSSRNMYQVRLWLNEVSYDLNANQSNVNWTLYRYSTSSSYHSYDQTKVWPWGVSINGSGWGGNSNSIAFKVGGAGATETIATGSLTVQHDGNGNATIGYSGYDGPGSNIFGSASCSGSYGLSRLR